MRSRIFLTFVALCLSLAVAGPAGATRPKTVNFSATCDGQPVSGSTIMNSSPLLVLHAEQAIIKYELGVNTATGQTFTYTVPGFTKNSLPTTTCVFRVPYLPDWIFTTQVYFTPATH
jgi:hypothetical protein